MATLIDVTCPAGVAAGDLVEFQDANGTTMQVAVPEGVSEGMTFQVSITEEGNPIAVFNSFVANRAASGDIADKFVAWFEQAEIGKLIDDWIKTNAHLLGGEGVSGEQSHEWWPLYQQYQAQFEALLQTFVEGLGISVEDFLAAAKNAEGMNEAYIQIFLAHSDYEMFMEQMRIEFNRQARIAREVGPPPAPPPAPPA
eukprot:TRINITY_DN16830_c2_g1_i1.p1 TRINITY_DN16830_c2_g1~~TRINITY_DN16830_c2_g1_i1.p1  ORF type:complete len:198 (-),score=47.33 TRINITY_DN16830_c2_g1_i1:183-776(-)